MSEKILNEEQPEFDACQIATAGENEGAKADNNGSLFGKFKTANQLLNAYNNLQAEFTRKCQKLSELKSDNVANDLVAPQFQNDNWQNKISQFLMENADANNYAYEISNILLNNNEISKLSNSLEVAYALVKSKSLKSDKELINDDNFINNYILNNENITNKIIKKYLKGISENAPLVMAENKSSISLTPKSKPKNLFEAKILAQNLFKK